MEKNKSPFIKNYSFAYPKIVALGFFLIIAIGTVLLMTPFAVKSGSVSFLDALFTATSATCVTGLVVFDTFQKWTLFGQLVILAMIQIGGLGFITILSTVAKMVKRRITLKEKMLLKESVGSVYIGGVFDLGKLVLKGTILFEGLGALIMCTRFIPLMGVKNGIYTSIFMSISAFCNAGFDVMGRIEPSSSLVTINNDPIVLLTISILIIVGGLGFIVWDDILQNKGKLRHLRLHTKLVLITTAVLLLGGTLLYVLFEYNNTFSGMNIGRTALNAFFTSTTTRTAGFNSVSTGDMTNLAKMLTMVLMFIGGSSGSTAGGVKTSTVAVIFLCISATVKNKGNVNSFNRCIDFDVIRKAISIVFINMMEVFTATTLISLFQKNFNLIDVMFECFSALGTVGMTAGITPLLSEPSKVVIILLMFVGRITSLVFALMFFINKPKTTSVKPRGTLVIG